MPGARDAKRGTAWSLALICGLALLGGCSPAPAPEFQVNQVQWLKLEKTKLAPGETWEGQIQQQVARTVETMFGTPDQPRFPYLDGDEDPFHEIVNLAHVQRAAGPVKSDEAGRHFGLYREHCAHCHGVTGDGTGPTALTLNPYPRDFRLGKFKFKQTPLRTPPTDDDMLRLLTEGIPGTAMPSFKALPAEDLAALVDYVKYLTIRGEFERYLIEQASDLDGDPLWETGEVAEDVLAEASFDNPIWKTGAEYLEDSGILDRWFDRDDNIVEVPPQPVTFDPSSAEFRALVATGQQLFAGKANCVQCHGQNGLGDGQLGNYDDWTNDWLKTPGVDLADRNSYREFLRAGALPPRVIRPRNLEHPVYRGGNTAQDLYIRVKSGIEGTPMPSSVGLTEDEIWAVVAYIRSLPYAARQLSGSSN